MAWMSQAAPNRRIIRFTLQARIARLISVLTPFKRFVGSGVLPIQALGAKIEVVQEGLNHANRIVRGDIVVPRTSASIRMEASAESGKIDAKPKTECSRA